MLSAGRVIGIPYHHPRQVAATALLRELEGTGAGQLQRPQADCAAAPPPPKTEDPPSSSLSISDVSEDAEYDEENPPEGRPWHQWCRTCLRCVDKYKRACTSQRGHKASACTCCFRGCSKCVGLPDNEGIRASARSAVRAFHCGDIAERQHWAGVMRSSLRGVPSGPPRKSPTTAGSSKRRRDTTEDDEDSMSELWKLS